MASPATPSDRSPREGAFCTCLDPRFDAVTLKTGERHSEFCCACGRPGFGDVVSGRPLVADMPEPMQLLEPNAYQDFTAPLLSSENPPSLFIAKARSKTDGPSYRFSWESPAPAETAPASTTEVNASTFAYAPGERDAYPVGQAPGESARWAEILASTPRGAQ